MGRQALLAVACWLTISLAFGDKITHNIAVQDNESAESAPRLYRNIPLGVYASAAPYGAYSFHLPTFIAPKTSASQVVPVKENFVNHLTDSYGNKFVGTPQLSSYRMAFPQQFVPLQTTLPEHLAQPLVAASANFQFNPSNGQFFGAPYRVPALQGPAPTPLNHFPTFGQLYGEKVQNFAPSSVGENQAFRIPNAQPQPTNNKAVFTNTQSNDKNEQKFSQQKEPQIITGKPKEVVQEIHHDIRGENKSHKIQEALHSSHGEPKLQRTQEIPQKYYREGKSQRIQDTPQSHHDESNLKQNQHHSSSGDERYQRIQEFPHYESKFQIIEDKPYSSQLHGIQEYHAPHGEQKFQRLHEAPLGAQTQHIYESPQEKPQHLRHGGNTQTHGNKAKLQAAPGKQIVTYVNDINGEKTVVELETKPSLPLLDLTLLEPLTFENPLVPQVQHFLPKIHQATYRKLPEAIPAIKQHQKEYDVQKTTSFNNADGHEKPQKQSSKKKHKKPTQTNKYPKNNDVPKKTSGTHHETLDDAPEIVYEVNSPISPNYKETVKQKAVSYNKETQSEPVHYSYGSKSEKEPVTYSYSRTAKEPLQIMNVQYHGNAPTHLIYTLNPEEQAHEERSHNSAPHHSESEERDSSHELNDDGHPHHQNHQHTGQYKEGPGSAEEQHELRETSPKEKENYHEKKEQKTQEIEELEPDNPPKYYSEPAHLTSDNINFQPILKEYENNIRLLTAPSASIKVDPDQHVKHANPTPQSHVNDEDHPHPRHHSYSSSAPQLRSHSSDEPHKSNHHSVPHSETPNKPVQHIHEKSKRIIIQEESPDEMHMLREQMREEVIKREENSEEDFEKGYHDAAIGFPAYSQKSDPEKDIFDPASYGVPRDQIEYDFDHTPLQQYQDESDDFPKETRSRYKDARDKTMQNYYSDYSIRKPESMLDRYQNKLGYYKLYKEQKPDYVTDDEEDNKKNQKSAKYSAAPSFAYNSPDGRSKSYYGSSKPKQELYEYDYSKGTPRDNSAFASRPYQSYKSRTSFVEPQFQYGFEPIAIPKLLDSELAAMASNDSPESEKPGMRKKIYKENWYIKKTSTSTGSPAS